MSMSNGRTPYLPSFARDVIDQAPSLPPSIADPLIPHVIGASEIGVRTFKCLALADPSTETPTVVYSTQKRWRGVDVYIQTDYASAGDLGSMIVQVFANIRGLRTLVASGRTRATPGKRIAAVRCIADTFDVVVARDRTVGVSADASCQIVVMATDESLVTPADPLEACVTPDPADAQVVAHNSGVIANGMPVQLCALSAVNTAAAIRYLMAFNKASAPALNDAPRFSIALPVGLSLFVSDAELQIRRYDLGLQVAPSTTGGLYTEPGGGDFLVFYNAWLR